MKQLVFLFVILTSVFSFGQELSKERLYESKKQLREGNKIYEKGKFDDAAISYQKSLAADGTYYKGAYNLGNAYFKEKKYKEATEQYQLANKLAKTKEEKAKTNELIGDVFKKQNQLEKALESYKKALLKNPDDDILREKFVAAKQEKKKQDDQKKKDDKNKDKKDDKKDKDNKDKGDNKDKNKDKNGDKNKKDDKGDDKKDKDNKDNKQDKDNKDGDDKEQPKPQPKESKLSPEQIKQLLESMSNEEQKTQKKVNAQKAKVKTNKNEKDW